MQSTRSGLPGSIATSIMLRSCDINPAIVNLANVGLAAIALNERKIPRTGVTLPNVPLMPPMPETDDAKIIFGSDGWTTIVPIARPVKTSVLAASLFKGPVTRGEAELALSIL